MYKFLPGARPCQISGRWKETETHGRAKRVNGNDSEPVLETTFLKSNAATRHSG
ncbi:MAG: hypothetical protein H6862_03595 [Rhodospirillales bacterium]|nr:hypothetical protein [Rhodospirillales bacterium]